MLNGYREGKLQINYTFSLAPPSRFDFSHAANQQTPHLRPQTPPFLTNPPPKKRFSLSTYGRNRPGDDFFGRRKLRYLSLSLQSKTRPNTLFLFFFISTFFFFNSKNPHLEFFSGAGGVSKLSGFNCFVLFSFLRGR